jgi:hypothetical protein
METLKESEMNRTLIVYVPRDIETLRSRHSKMFQSLNSAMQRYKKTVMESSSLNEKNDDFRESRKGPDESAS